jgi:hypothetical protein
LTENSLYTRAKRSASTIDHLSDRGVLTITRWVFDGLRLVSLAQAACAQRGMDASKHLAIVRFDRVATFLLKKQPFTEAETATLMQRSRDPRVYSALRSGGSGDRDGNHDPIEMARYGTGAGDYRKLILAADASAFSPSIRSTSVQRRTIRPLLLSHDAPREPARRRVRTDDAVRQGLSALLTLFGISAVLVLLFIIGPLLLVVGQRGIGWPVWLAYSARLARASCCSRSHCCSSSCCCSVTRMYSLTVTLFSLLLGTGIGSLMSRRIAPERVKAVTIRSVIAIAARGAACAMARFPRLINVAIPWPLAIRVLTAVIIMLPLGFLLGIPLPGGMRLLAAHRPEIISVGLGPQRRLLVVGATLAVFIAMNWASRPHCWREPRPTPRGGHALHTLSCGDRGGTVSHGATGSRSSDGGYPTDRMRQSRVDPRFARARIVSTPEAQAS